MGQENTTAGAKWRARRAALLRNEDWLAVWLGFLLIALALFAAGAAGPTFRWGGAGELVGKVLAGENLLRTVLVAATVFVLAGVGVALLGGDLPRFAAGFPVVYALALVALLIAGNGRVRDLGLEFVLFALLIGLFISNVVGVPPWLREAVRTEFYIKTGLVILGAGILFGEVLQAGFLGLAQALGVVLVVWFVTFWLARKLRVDDEFAAMLSTAVSICGVSAAIAACGAIQGDRRKLSYVTSLVLVVAVPMMVFMPWVVRGAGIPDVVGGAWLGGTLDTSGAVVAAGALIGDAALKASVVVKFSQNVLIGVAAFLLSVWWTLRPGTEAPKERPTLWVIWERFPKFVLGFLAASLVFSFLIAPPAVKQAKPLLDTFRTAWFALAFTSIGLETRFADLVKMEGGRPALAFLGGQAFNVLWTLLLAFLLFGGLLFAAPVFE